MLTTPATSRALLTHAAPFVLLDGAVGSELRARGADIRQPLDNTDDHDDYWSGMALLTAPHVVYQLHADYAAAGADVITTDTFRVNRLVLHRLARPETVEALLTRAVALASRAAPGRLIGGSVGPIEAYDAPHLAPADEQLNREHEATLRALRAVGVTLLLAETMNSIREARLVARLARELALPCWISYTVGPDGHLPTGESLSEAVEALLPHHPEAVLINHCTTQSVDRGLPVLATVLAGTGTPYGARPHLPPEPTHGDNDPQHLAGCARRWLDTGARVLGGCCGTNPRHTAALQRLRHTSQHNSPGPTQGGQR